jgi:hypothetical protein
MIKFSRNLLLFSGMAMAITACNDEHDHNHIDISFLEPVNDQVIPMAEANDVHIHVRFEADEENHQVYLRLYPEGEPNNLILDLDLHDHDQVIDIEEDLDLSSFPAGTEFHLEAEACEDHDCEEVVSADIHFSIN